VVRKVYVTVDTILFAILRVSAALDFAPILENTDLNTKAIMDSVNTRIRRFLRLDGSVNKVQKIVFACQDNARRFLTQQDRSCRYG
jgi:hypothetical protein